MKSQHLLCSLALALAALAFTSPLHADGIPEPGIIYYGTITNSANANAVLTNGTSSLSWQVQGPNGTAVAVVTPIQSITNSSGGRFSFRFRVPFESVVGGNTLSTGAFALLSQTATYTNSSVNISRSGVLTPATMTFGTPTATLAAGQRALVQRINLTVNAVGATAVGSGGAGPGSRTNLVAQTAGTNPALQFVYVAPHPDGGIYLEWIGAPTNRPYYLLRSQEVSTQLENQEVVHQFPAIPGGLGSFWDTNVVNTTTYFYKIVAQ